MKTAQKSRRWHSAGFLSLYTFAGTRQMAAVCVLALAGALAFAGCDSFMETQQDEQPVPSFKAARQSVLTIEPSSAELESGGTKVFRAKMGGYAAGVEWTLSGDNISEETKMSGNELIVAEDQESTNITLRATLNSNRKYTATAMIIIKVSGQDVMQD